MLLKKQTNKQTKNIKTGHVGIWPTTISAICCFIGRLVVLFSKMSFVLYGI